MNGDKWNEMLFTGLGAFFGAVLSLLVSVAMEFMKKPRLELIAEDPPVGWQRGSGVRSC